MGYARNYYGNKVVILSGLTVPINTKGEIDIMSSDSYDIPKPDDMVNNPPHYNVGNVECIDAIEAAMSGQAFEGYLKGNVLKYIWRYEKKGGTQDLEKAKWYLVKLLEVAKVNEFFSITEEDKPGM